MPVGLRAPLLDRISIDHVDETSSAHDVCDLQEFRVHSLSRAWASLSGTFVQERPVVIVVGPRSRGLHHEGFDDFSM
jgi:hypothetical protein